MNIYVACAEHDKSCPYADAWQLVAYSLFVRNMINHALTLTHGNSLHIPCLCGT